MSVMKVYGRITPKPEVGYLKPSCLYKSGLGTLFFSTTILFFLTHLLQILPFKDQGEELRCEDI